MRELTAESIIEQLQLEKHIEGGYFRRNFCSEYTISISDQSRRPLMTSIYYLLTQESHISYFAQNKSDLVLYHHFGDPLKIIFLHSDGHIEEKILGNDLLSGQVPQIVCPGGIWKAYDLMDGNLALVGEAVSPGFDYEDMQIATRSLFAKEYPQHLVTLSKYIMSD